MTLGSLGAPRSLRWYLERERAILGTLSVVGFFVFWEVGAAQGWIETFFFASPSRVARAALLEVQTPRFWTDLQVSGSELVVGFLAATVLGIPLGLLAGWYRTLGYFVDPWLNFLNALPRATLVPLAVLWVGVGIWSKIVIVFLEAVVTIVVNTLWGVRTVDRAFLDVAASFNASRWRVFTTVVLPSTVPFMLAGLRLGIGRALLGIVVAEVYAANAGIGYMIAVAGHTIQTDRLLFGVLILTLLGVAGVELLRLVERRFEEWRPRVGAR